VNGCFLRFGSRDLRTQQAADAYLLGLWRARVWLNQRDRVGRLNSERYGFTRRKRDG
jgi:hypothetical protein